MADKTNKTEREKINIEVNPKVQFEATTETKFMSPNDICAQINSIFKPVFADYEGCSIQLNSQNAAGQSVPGVSMYPAMDGVVADVPLNTFYATIYFKDHGKSSEAMIKNLVPANKSNTSGEVNPNSIAARFAQFTNTRMNSRLFNVSAETLEALEKFMYVPQFSKEIPKDYWKRHIIEYTDIPTSYLGVTGSPVVSVRITGLNLTAILSEIFGTKDETGGRMEYLVTPYIPPTMNGISKDVLFQVSRLNDKVLNQFVNGMFSGSYVSSTYVSAV